MKSPKEIVESLQKEPLFTSRSEKLTSHPMVVDAKTGKLPLQVVGTFLCGQFHIITANIRSMDHLVTRSDLQNYEPRAEAQGYPSHFCLLAHYGDAPQIAAAIAVNFPPFREMCANIADALKENCSLKEEDVDFLRFFEICDLDEGAVKLVIEAYAASEKGKQTPLEYKEIQRVVRLLQAYEDMLMASVYSQV